MPVSWCTLANISANPSIDHVATKLLASSEQVPDSVHSAHLLTSLLTQALIMLLQSYLRHQSRFQIQH